MEAADRREEQADTDSLERALVSRLGDAMAQRWATEGAEAGTTADAELAWLERGSPGTKHLEPPVPALHRPVDRGPRVAPVAADTFSTARSTNRRSARKGPRRRRFVLWSLLFVALFTAGFLFVRSPHWLSPRHGLDNRVAASVQPAGIARLEAGRPHAFGWVKVPSASYYLVRIFHDGHEVFEATPIQPRVVLPSAWSFRGRTHRLEVGPYRWVVQAGYGSRSASRYGRAIVSAEWVVPAR